MSKSKMSTGRPRVVHAFGIYYRVSGKAWRLVGKGTHVDNTRYVTLNWSTAKQEVYLVIVIPVTTQIFDNPKAALSVCYGRIHIMLLATLVNRESLARHVSHRARTHEHQTLFSLPQNREFCRGQIVALPVQVGRLETFRLPYPAVPAHP